MKAHGTLRFWVAQRFPRSDNHIPESAVLAAAGCTLRQ
jgi:hypothetical protein